MKTTQGRSVAVGLLVAMAAAFGADAAAAAAVKVAKPAGVPATVSAGQSFSVTVTIRNPGARKAKAAKVSLLLSKDARADAKDLALGGALKVKALAPRKRATVKGMVVVPAGASAGTYRLLACVGKACTAGGTVTVKARAAAPAPAAP